MVTFDGLILSSRVSVGELIVPGEEIEYSRPKAGS